MNEDDLRTEIARIKSKIINTSSYFKKRDLSKYLKQLRRQLRNGDFK